MYTVLKLFLRQNERYRTFGMVATGTSITQTAKLFGYPRIFIHSLVRRFGQLGTSIDAQDQERRCDKTVNHFSRNNVINSCRQL